MTPPLRGCGTALVTPFTADGALDEDALRAFVEWQVNEGVHFVVPCGSTGEAVTMTLEEQRRVVEITVQQVAGRVPVVAGAGSNDTKKAIAASKMMRDAGATHLLHVSPMYNKPPQRGIIAHFKAIAAEAGLPIVVYNVPGRTGINIEAKTTLTLAQIPNIVAIKEASGNLAQVHEILLNRPPGFAVLSGDDALTLAMMAAGAEGVISVTSNATPHAMAQLCNHLTIGNLPGARALHHKLLPWMEAAFCEPNPIPAKAACAMLGKMQPTVRLPLVPLAAEKEPVVRQALQAAGALA